MTKVSFKGSSLETDVPFGGSSLERHTVEGGNVAAALTSDGVIARSEYCDRAAKDLWDLGVAKGSWSGIPNSASSRDEEGMTSIVTRCRSSALGGSVGEDGGIERTVTR